jgi:hypothetical protein
MSLATSSKDGLYWGLAGILVVFGVVAIFSIGLPFLSFGVALLILGRWRDQPRIFWPPLVGILSFFIGYILIAPGGCTATATLPGDPEGHTTCSNILGLDYSGEGSYNPPLWPALVAGLGLAAMGAALPRLVLRRHRS